MSEDKGDERTIKEGKLGGKVWDEVGLRNLMSPPDQYRIDRGPNWFKRLFYKISGCKPEDYE